LWKKQASLSRIDALWAHKVFVLERLYFASSLIACAIGIGKTLIVLMPSVIFTLLSQARLRDRYEFTEQGTESKPLHAASNQIDRHTSEISAPNNNANSNWSREAMSVYLREQVTRLSHLPPLRNWPRRLQLRLEDIDLTMYLVNTPAGDMSHVGEQEYFACTHAELLICTDTKTFRETFIDATMSPIAAYRMRLVRLRCSPLDMVRLNTVFKALRVVNNSKSQLEFSSLSSPSLPSPSTHEDDVLEDILKQQVVVADTTLRDGEQAPGVAFSVQEKIAIATTLDTLHIPLIEVGFPAVSTAEREAIREIVGLQLKATIQVIARPLERDIDAALQTGASSVAIFIGTSDSHIANKLRTTRSQVLKAVTHAVEYAKRANVQVVFAPEDATRTEWQFLLEVSQAAISAGADVLGVPDTTGAMTPSRMFRLVRQLVRSVPVPIAVHCHNDLGLATANSIAGLLAGASGAQCSLLGIGERAGNAALEEVATALEVAYSCNTGIDLTRLPQAASQLSHILGWPQPPHKAIVGANAFVHESGLHTDGVVRDPRTYESFPPERVGQQRRYIFGKHSGRSAIRHVLEARGLACDDALCGSLLEAAKQRGQAKHPMDEEALVHLALEQLTTVRISPTGVGAA
ncbi:MAG TPA: hypothetical protein VKP30_01535, partial [Polyangiaceae bacterium]|nr:hypothetical protein [Polyangiaceae bacterium]